MDITPAWVRLRITHDLAVGNVLEGRVHPSLLAIPGHAVALEIAQMRINGFAGRHKLLAAPGRLHSPRQLDDARLHHDAARAKADAVAVLPPSAADLWQPCRHLAASAASVEAATPLPRACADAIGIAALLADGDLDLAQEGQRARVDRRTAAARPAGANLEPVAITICHDDSIESQIARFKMAGTQCVLWPAKTCCGVEAAERTSLPHRTFAFQDQLDNGSAGIFAPRFILPS
jgi:hypothetical protein